MNYILIKFFFKPWALNQDILQTVVSRSPQDTDIPRTKRKGHHERSRESRAFTQGYQAAGQTLVWLCSCPNAQVQSLDILLLLILIPR